LCRPRPTRICAMLKPRFADRSPARQVYPSTGHEVGCVTCKPRRKLKPRRVLLGLRPISKPMPVDSRSEKRLTSPPPVANRILELCGQMGILIWCGSDHRPRCGSPIPRTGQNRTIYRCRPGRVAFSRCPGRIRVLDGAGEDLPNRDLSL
jgi:hypothetical protein